MHDDAFVNLAVGIWDKPKTRRKCESKSRGRLERFAVNVIDGNMEKTKMKGMISSLSFKLNIALSHLFFFSPFSFLLQGNFRIRCSKFIALPKNTPNFRGQGDRPHGWTVKHVRCSKASDYGRSGAGTYEEHAGAFALHVTLGTFLLEHLSFGTSLLVKTMVNHGI